MTDRFLLGNEQSIWRIGFGAMRLTQAGWNGPARDPEVGVAVLRRAVELGVDHIDTAARYRSQDGSVSANRLIREALHPYPADLVVATKVGPIFGSDGDRQAKPTASDSYRQAEPTELREQVEENLRELGVDRLDLVYLRIGHLGVPRGESIAERFEVLAALREEGLIRHLGLSNVDVGQLAEACAIAPVTAVQNHFNPVHSQDTDLLAACEERGVGFVAFGSLGSGRGELDDTELAAVAARHGISIAQAALAWLFSISPVTLAIPGSGSIAHLEENLEAIKIALSEDDLALLGAHRPAAVQHAPVAEPT
jgi:aryl-alcohol dehydrogenase-like predicted oxidoreductase